MATKDSSLTVYDSSEIAGAPQDISPTEVVSAMDLAWSMFDAGRIEEAIEISWRCLQTSPRDANIGCAMAWFEMALDRDSQAADTLAIVLQIDPTCAVAHWYDGILKKRAHHVDAAEKAFLLALSLDPTLTEAKVSLGWLLADHAPAKALPLAQDALAEKETPNRQLLLAWIFHRLGRTEEAVTLVKAVLNAGLVDDVSLSKAIQVLIATGRTREVVQHLVTFENRNAKLDAHLGNAHRALGETKQALVIAEALTRDTPDAPEGWQLLLSLNEDRGDLSGCLVCLERLAALKPEDMMVTLRRAALLIENGQYEAAVKSLPSLDGFSGRPADEILLLSQITTRLQQFDAARRLLHTLTEKEDRRGIAWSRLSDIFNRLGKPLMADLAGRRASRLAPWEPEIWGTIGWQSLERGNIDKATNANRRARALLDRDKSFRIQSVYILLHQDPQAANREAEDLVREYPQSAECLAPLAQVRLVQKSFLEAYRYFRQAVDLQPTVADFWSGMAFALIPQDRLLEADEALSQARLLRPENRYYRTEHAILYRLMGRFADALDLLRTAANNTDRLLIEEARNEFHLGYHQEGKARDEHWQRAHDCLARVLRRNSRHSEASAELLRLAAFGDGRSEAARELANRPDRERIYSEQLAAAIARRGVDEAAAWSRLARQDGFTGAMMEATDLYLRLMRGGQSIDEIFRDVRGWTRRFSAETGWARPRPVTRGKRLRVAYLAAIPHPAILFPVITAHDESVDISVYTSDPATAIQALPGRCTIFPWNADTLETALLAGGYDVVIDTVGMHPLCRQDAALKALQRRVATVQCGWLGANWGTSGGLYDAIFLDEACAPDGNLQHYSEEIIRIPGGQWAWEPPRLSPPLTVPPSQKNGFITFGVSNRSFRFSSDTLRTWAEVLQRLPGARLEILGDQNRDWVHRHDFAKILQSMGVDGDRVGYRGFRPYADSLAFMQEIDIFLDCFPGAGGLSSLDALWMGVPLVTLSGAAEGWSGARQGASVLAAIGRADWLTDTADAYVEKALALAADEEGRAEWRREARRHILASPLCDGRRVAAELESHSRRLLSDYPPAEDFDGLIETTARRRLAAFHGNGRKIAFPATPTPDLSVVIALNRKAPSLLATLEALADEQDVALEVILVDCGADTEATRLLPSIEGLRVLSSPTGTSPAEAINLGAEKARAPLLLVLDGSVVVTPGALRSAVQTMADDYAVGGLAARLTQADGTLKEAGSVLLPLGQTIAFGRGDSPQNSAYLHRRDIDFCSTDFLLTRTDHWQMFGGFSTDPVQDLGLDYCQRLRSIGLRIAYDPDVLAASHTAPNPGAVPSYRLGSGDRERVLMIDFAIPHQGTGAGLPRAKLMVEALAATRHVTYYPLHKPFESRRQLKRALPDTVEVVLDQGVAGLEGFLSARIGTFDILLVSRPTNMNVVQDLKRRRPDLFQGMRIVYDAEALFALREAAEAALKGRALPLADQRMRIKNEIALARDADAILCVSPMEGRYFVGAGHLDVRVAAHAVIPRTNAPGPQKRRGLLFVGALVPGTPNEDGLEWFVTSILPHLRGTPRLTIVGTCLSNRIAALAGPQVRLVGGVRDLGPLYDSHRLFVAPTRFAAGVPAKVIEAAGAGIPVVASALLAQQLEWQDGQELLSADDGDTFIQAIDRLIEDDALWLDLQARALAQTALQFDPQRFAATVREVCRRPDPE
ncbi:glycosyltransferase [Lacibacterium aquatile]|uniref:protein O-GlcNAc transferase n=1 Tax=Lacibacterium aquatile TaxID=1168082 RepID=A0ABW5DX55_9PROT